MELRKLLAGFVILVLFLLSCSYSSDITVSSNGEWGSYTYSIDGTNFQANDIVDNLAGGEYTVEVKDRNGCTDDSRQKIEEIQKVFYTNQIRPIIDHNCQVSNWHGSNPNMPSWAIFSDVKASALKIKTRTGNVTIPTDGSLYDSYINLIGNWVDIGTPENRIILG